MQIHVHASIATITVLVLVLAKESTPATLHAYLNVYCINYGFMCIVAWLF